MGVSVRFFGIFLIIFSAFTNECIVNTQDKNSFDVSSLFSPDEGADAFTKIFDKIENAQSEVLITIYSWSMGQIKTSVERACENGAQVKILMASRHENKREDTIQQLDALECVDIKVSPKNMHEKIVIVDDQFAVNTSANFSPGARSKYNENFIFFEDFDPMTTSEIDCAIKDLKQEFSILWNYGRDSKFDVDESEIINIPYLDELFNVVNLPGERAISFYSSSMNFNITVRDNGSLYLRRNPRRRVVETAIVDAINNAEHSVYLSVNYLLLPNICSALETALERGIDVKAINDNKGINDWDDCTYQLAKDYPERFRFKVYSFFATAGKAYLNHNKFLIIDYYPDETISVKENTILISGSHNLSETAETNQFDNMMFFKTEKYRDLYESFYEDFLMVFDLKRAENEPEPEVLASILRPFRGHYRIHFPRRNVVSLTIPEYRLLLNELNEIAPGMLDKETVPADVLKNCDYYNPSTELFYTYSSGEFEYCGSKREVEI